MFLTSLVARLWTSSMALMFRFTLWVPDRRCVFEMWSHECVEQLLESSAVPSFECSLECCEYGVGCVDASSRLYVCRK